MVNGRRVEGLEIGDVLFYLPRDGAIVRRMKSTYELVCGNGAMLERVWEVMWRWS